jgi:hypothetical protein
VRDDRVHEAVEPGDSATLPATVAAAGGCSSTSPGELPALASLGERDRLLLATWLVGLRYIEVLAARRVHVDLWVSVQLSAGAAETSVRRRHGRPRVIASAITRPVGKLSPSFSWLALRWSGCLVSS